MIFLSTNSRFNFKKITQLKALPEIQWRNRGKTGGGHYEKQNALPVPGWKNMLYKVTSRYTAKFLGRSLRVFEKNSESYNCQFQVLNFFQNERVPSSRYLKILRIKEPPISGI
jgi:predicted SprT family Zn-dependent metalloprotease